MKYLYKCSVQPRRINPKFRPSKFVDLITRAYIKRPDEFVLITFHTMIFLLQE